MNKLIVLLSAVALISFTSCKNDAKKKPELTTVANSSNTSEKPYAGRIAFVNIDTFEAHYEHLKSKRDAFQKKQIAIENELVKIERQLESEAGAFQKKIQGGTMTQTEGEATQKRLMQQGQALEQKRQTYTDQLMKEQQEFNSALQKDLQGFLKEYNQGKGYDYILSYAEGGSILLTNEALDVTQDVIEGMNALKSGDGAASKSNNTDSVKK